MSDEQFIDDLFAREGLGWEKTPGFRDFVLDLMSETGTRPRAGDVSSMHLAYRAGIMEQNLARNRTPDRPEVVMNDEVKFGLCRECAPEQWPKEQHEHRCARSDEDGMYGTIVLTRYSHTHQGHVYRYIIRTWPWCEKCDNRYCTECGVHAWYQCL